MIRLKSPLSVQLELTDACNNACAHCYNYWRYIETGQILNKDEGTRTLAHFIHIIEILASYQIRTLVLTGGEPFLRRDILFTVVNRAKKADMIVGVNTNGVLISESDVNILKCSGVDFVLLSLLADDPAIHNAITHTQSHGSTIRALELLIREEIDVSVNMVVSNVNFARIRQTAELVHSIGARAFSATPVIPCYLAKEHGNILLSPGQIKQVLENLMWAEQLGLNVDVLEPLAHCIFSPSEHRRFIQFLNHRSCSAGITEAAISANGDMRPCIHADTITGNILIDGWKKCWGKLQRWANPDILPDECLSCKVVDFCGGGCRMAALNKNGCLSGKDPYMTRPITKKRSYTVKDYKPVSWSERDVLKKCDGFSLRKEDFGGIVFSCKRYMFLKRQPFDFLRSISGKSLFSTEELLEEFDIDRSELKLFLDNLLSKGILEVAERR